MKYRRTYGGNIETQISFKNHEWIATYKVDGFYSPGSWDEPPDGEENVELTEINGYDADDYLKRLSFWSPAASKYIRDYEPDTHRAWNMVD